MEMNSITYQESTRSCIGCLCGSLNAMFGKFKAKVMEIVKQTKKIGQDDPRRIVHAIKVGLALTFVSLFYYIRPLYDGFGQAGMWAILTVVVVFEFTVVVVQCKDDMEKSYLQTYKSVLNSKATEESLANFAWWELGHGRFKFHHPWKLYLKMGVLVRECACHIEVASEFQLKIQSTCKNMSIECSKALKELSFAVKNMTFPSPAAKIHIQNSIATADDFKNILETSSLSTKTDLQEIMSVLVTASVLIDIIRCVEKISASIDELSQKAGFRKPVKSLDKQQQLLHRGIVKPVNDHVVLEISETVGGSVDDKKLRSGIVKLIDDISGGNDQIVIMINETLEESEPENKNPRPSEREQ
ncbi:UNVERIFIED_CONTAM: Aluminum-activated malate transporter 8 [Sesamum latifolium]|uniref:Aluminum-activated malate transporter 8 n=1 Tax=Sesamum latifolium TaxID=2727402 RepID=A0AAW2TZZ7_9LAMI